MFPVYILLLSWSLISWFLPAVPVAESLQQGVTDAMRNRQGTAFAMDVQSGRILASYRMDVAARRVASPGSTVKPFTLLALMDAGLVSAETAVFCPHTVRIGNRVLDCSHAAGVGAIDPVKALAYSCNYFFISLSARLPIDGLYRAFSTAGFSSMTGRWTSEISGTVQQPRSTDSLQLMSIGEDSIAVTPLALGEAYRRLALQLPEHPLIGRGLEAAVRMGTAQAAAIKNMHVAGKTGTSDGHAWFAGFAPAERPEIVVLVFLESGRGGNDAAPIAGRMFAAYAASRTAR